MKKLLLSLLVLGAFFVYGLHQKNERSDIKVIPPNPKQEPQTTEGALPTSSQPTPTLSAASGYKDGTYTGNGADAFYGTIQVKATISGGKITDVQFLQYPNDRDTSIQINQQAMPILKQEAIQAQSANIDIVSGATDSSRAFRESLQSALDQSNS